MSKNKRFVRNENNMLLGIIGDEETVTGFLLAGIGERSENFTNFLKVNSQTKNEQIEEFFHSLVTNKNIGIILISQDIADRIRDTLDAYNEIIPTVLEIPSKHHPYSIEKDSIMQKALRQLYGQNIPDELKNN
jgi:V-type H+-transporting ATPase subunit F